MNALGAALVMSFTGFSFWLAFSDPRRCLLMMVFLMPWGGLYADPGLIISAYQIALFALLVCTIFRSLFPGWRPPPIAAARFLAAFVVFAILTSVIQISVIPQLELKADSGVLRGPTPRAIIQLFMFAFTLSPVVLVAWGVRTGDDVLAIARTYILSVVLLALVGWVQLTIWYKTGSNPLPIGAFNSLIGGAGQLSEGIINVDALPVYRMNSLAGEPRTLGGVQVYAMLMIQAIAATSPKVPRVKLLVVWIFLALSTLATLSTSAFLLWVVGSVLQFPVARLFGVRLRVSRTRLASLLGAIVLVVALAVGAIEASGFPLFDLISARTVERIDSNGAIEDFDLAIIDFLKANPARSIAGVGVGNAHLYAMPYIDPEFQWYALGLVFTAKTQYLKLVSETGFIGLFLFLAWFGVLMVNAAIAVHRPAARAYAAVIPVATMSLLLYFANIGSGPQFYIVAGVLSAVCLIARRRMPKLETQ
jgi:hypothetical protein